MFLEELLLPPTRLSIFEIESERNIFWTGETAQKSRVCLYLYEGPEGWGISLNLGSVLTHVFSATQPSKHLNTLSSFYVEVPESKGFVFCAKSFSFSCRTCEIKLLFKKAS